MANARKRAVIDTNVVIKMAISRKHQSASTKIRNALDEKRFISVTSKELLADHLSVLERMVPENQAELFVTDFVAASEVVQLTSDSSILLPLVRDVTDLDVIRTAVDGNADYLVTDNIRDFSKQYRTLAGNDGQVIKPSRFLDLLGIKKSKS